MMMFTLRSSFVSHHHHHRRLPTIKRTPKTRKRRSPSASNDDLNGNNIEHDDVDDPLIQQPGGVSGTMPSLPFADAMPIAPPHLLGPPPGGPRGSSLSNMSPLEPNMLASQDGPSNTEDAFFGPL